MPHGPDIPPTTSVLLIDEREADRTHWAVQLKQCSPDYEIVEATDGQSGLDVCKSRRIDCVVLEIELPDISGFEVLTTLVPRANKPNMAVIVLTQLMHRGVRELARTNGAYVCFVKRHTTGEDLDRAIQRAVALVGQMPKEDRYRNI
ncbi:MAG TPA: response regulator [Nitrospiraceae bacterium]|nr:response regulator [Nitrospiraceae bacterium]